jgi:hypothetical protein
MKAGFYLLSPWWVIYPFSRNGSWRNLWLRTRLSIKQTRTISFRQQFEKENLKLQNMAEANLNKLNGSLFIEPSSMCCNVPFGWKR